MIKTKKQAISAVKEIQKKAGWSMSRVAGEAGLHRATIIRMMAGEHSPSYNTRSRLFILLSAVREM